MLTCQARADQSHWCRWSTATRRRDDGATLPDRRRHRAPAAAGPLRGRHDQGRRRRGRWRSSPPTAPTAPSATPTRWPTSRPWSRPRPRACSWSGRRRSSSTATTGTGQQPLCFVDQTDPRHAHRLLHRHLPPHADGWRLHTRAMTFLRRAARATPGGRTTRPARPAARRPLTPARWSSTSSGRRSTPGSTSTTTSSRPTTPAPARSTQQMAQLAKVKRLDLRRRLDALGLARAGRRARRLDAAAGLPRRGAHGPRPGRARPLLDDRGAGPDHDRLRLAGAGRRHGAAAAAGRRDLVPGLLRAGHRQQPRRAVVPGHPRPTTAGGSPARRSGPAWPSTPSAASCSPAPARPSRPTGASPPCSSTWTRPGITVRPIETMHGAARVLRGLLRRRGRARRPHARRRGPGLVGGHGPAALRAQHRAVAPGRLPPPAARSSCSTRRRAGALDPAAARRGDPAALRLPGPVAGHPAPAGAGRAPRARRPRSTRCWWPRPSRRCSTWSPTGWPPR